MAKAVSADGSVVFGSYEIHDLEGVVRKEATRWNEDGTMQRLGYLDGGSTMSRLHETTNDGSAAVGGGYDGTSIRPTVWTAEGGFEALPYLRQGNNEGRAVGISDDASLIAGWCTSDYDVENGMFSSYGFSNYSPEATIWRLTGDGYVAEDLDTLNEYDASWAVNASLDGTTVVGNFFGEQDAGGFFWTEATGMQRLDAAEVEDVTANGQFVVGNKDGEAWIWDAWETDLQKRQAGWSLSSMLTDEENEGRHFSRISSVSADGQVMVGGGWLVTLDQPLVSSAVPEPTSFAMFAGLGVMGLIAARRRKRAA